MAAIGLMTGRSDVLSIVENGVMPFRPLSKRNRRDPRFDEVQPGLPDYLLQPAIGWLRGLLWIEDPSQFRQVPNAQLLQTMQIALRCRHR